MCLGSTKTDTEENVRKHDLCKIGLTKYTVEINITPCCAMSLSGMQRIALLIVKSKLLNCVCCSAGQHSAHSRDETIWPIGLVLV